MKLSCIHFKIAKLHCFWFNKQARTHVSCCCFKIVIFPVTQKQFLCDKQVTGQLFFLQVYNADGEFLYKFGSHGEGNGQFNAPTGVAVDTNGNIIVADWGNSRIQVSSRKTVFHFTQWAPALTRLTLLICAMLKKGVRQLRVLPVLH